MRSLFLFMAVALALSAAPAQVSVRLNLNIGNQPLWGPAGYDHVEYYYLPDIEVYYNVPEARFYYFDGGRWIGRSRLPSRFGAFDFYSSYKVVVNEARPYRRHATYRDQYLSYKGRHDQQPIRDSRDERYFVIKNHPEHSKWAKANKQNNGVGRGRGKGNKH